MVSMSLFLFLLLPDPSQAHKWICIWLKGVDSTAYWNKYLGMNITGFWFLHWKWKFCRVAYIIISPQALSIMHCAIEKCILWHISQITSHFPLFYLSMWFCFGGLQAGGGIDFLKDSYGSERLMIFWSSNPIFSWPMLLIWPLIFWNMLGKKSIHLF